MNTKGVRIENIVKEFKTHQSNKIFRAVDDVSLEIEQGELVTLLGPSGCGKTTTLRMIAGLSTPTSGHIFIGDDDVSQLAPNKRDTAMVFQSYAIFPHYNVFENIAYGLKLKKLDAPVIAEKVNTIIELVGLKGMEKRNPSQLSGGQQQRVALARALVMEPSVLLFDEPLSNLDAKLRVHMRTEIRNIQQRLGLTSVYVTHDQAEAMALSDRVIVMNKGKIEQIGSPQMIYQKPKTKFVADFIGVANIIPATVETVDAKNVVIDVFGKKESLSIENSPLRMNEKVEFVIRPEAVILADKGNYKGTVVQSVFMGHVQEYVVDFYGLKLNVQVANPIGKKIYTVGETVGVTFEANSLHIV